MDYVPTKFTCDIYGHIYGGVIKYTRDDNNVYLYIYNDNKEVVWYTVPFSELIDIASILCNSDEIYGYTTRGNVGYFYQPMQDIVFKTHIDENVWYNVVTDYKWQRIGTQPFLHNLNLKHTEKYI